MFSEELYRNILENIYEGVYFVDKNREITFWNKGAERITGFLAAEVTGQYCYANLLNHINEKGTALCLKGCPLHKTISDGLMREATVYLHHKIGHRVPVTVRTIAIYEGSEIIGAVEVFTDDAERHALIKNVKRLNVLAMQDKLTGLPNRRYTEEFLSSKTDEFNKLGIQFAVAFIDIDHFKIFNTRYGHSTGDKVLKMVADTFSSNIRNTDLIGRWGGEEFIAVFSGIDEGQLYSITEKIRMLVETSILRRENKDLHVTVSIGATLMRNEDTIEKVIERADELLYKSKGNGRNCVTIG